MYPVEHIFGQFLCLISCKHTFYGHLLQIRKLTRFTRFIRKVFATKILLSGKFLLFLTLVDKGEVADKGEGVDKGEKVKQRVKRVNRMKGVKW